MERNDSNRVAIAILIAAVLVAAAVVYLGRQMTLGSDDERVAALIVERLEAPGGALSEEAFNARVEQGIRAFADKQRESRNQGQERQPNELAKSVPPPSQDDHLYGDLDAAVTLIEYSDFECPFCKRFHGTAKQLVDASNGQVNWVYRHFPLGFHNPGAQKQAEAAECAAELGGNEAFWTFTDTIYARTRSNGKGFPIENLTPLAAEIGLDQTRFQECLDSERFADKVQQQMAAGARAGVSGTPGNILYHKPSGRVIAIHGAQPLERFQQAAQTLSTAAP
jgi:protein-disulfide isomerase